ncbi:hypothetical protein KCP70_15520 [Salmonella enterica subsp. enterica]|nr:hypothetical protein KCP70_15520 [Salmonella enterica subsp. enterica]
MAVFRKITSASLNPRRCCRRGNPERYRCRIAPRCRSRAFLPPDCQLSFPSQLRGSGMWFPSSAVLTSRFTAVFRRHGQTKQEASRPHHLGVIPRAHPIFPSPPCVTGSQVLAATPFTVPLRSSSRAPLSTMASFPHM